MLDRAPRILLVDDEQSIQTLLSYPLRKDGYEVVQAVDGREALARFGESTFDLVVLDVMMPRLDGLEVCRRLRAAGDRTPVLVLTARDGVPDRVRGLDAGADDYLVKPFALEELLARLRALLRRSGGAGEHEILRFADLELRPLEHTVSRGRREIALTRTEFLLLELFIRHPRQVLTRSQIFERVWGYDFGASSNSLEVYVGYLRRKLEAGGEQRLVQTIRGLGYVLREP
jgi:two-component system response regulator MprA